MEAAQEGATAEVAAKTKHKTKSHITGVFKSAGKHMAGFRGDVKVDGARKQVSMEDWWYEWLGGQLIKLGKIGDKVDKVLFRGNIKDDGNIDCTCVDWHRSARFH